MATTDTSVTWEDLEPGNHTLGVQLVNSNHTPLDSPVTAMVTITIPEPAPEPVATIEPAAPGPETAAPPAPSQTNWWLIGGLILAAVIVAGSAVYYLRQRKPGEV